MKIGRICVAGVAAFLFSSITGFLTCGWLFNRVYQIEPTNVWRSMQSIEDLPLLLFGSLILGLLFALVYDLLGKGVPGKSRTVKGLVFGLCVWAVGILPGMFSTFVFMNVATTVVVYWTLLGLIQTPLQGIIVALIVDDRPTASE